MSDEWRTDEPEVGQIAHVLYGSKIYLYECKKHESGAFKIWWNGDDWIRVNEADLNQWLPIVDEADFNQWQPITTPEERRLRAEVERLKGIICDAIPHVKEIRSGMEDADWDTSEIDELIGLMKAEAGGAG